MHRIITIVITVVMASGTLIAAGKGQGGGRGFFVFGGSSLDIEDLNATLRANGYTEFPDNFYTLGGGGHGIINRVVIGGEGHVLVGRETASGDYSTSMGGAYGLFDLGYVVFSRNNLSVYPLIGIGGGGMTLNIIERGTPTFDEVLDDPKRSVHLSTGGFMVSFALVTDYLFAFREEEEGKGGLALGIQVGYTFSLSGGGWTMDDIKVSGGPDMGITGPFVRVMIGGGGSGKK